MRVTLPSGGVDFVRGIGVLQYIADNTKHGEFDIILLDAEMRMPDKDVFEIEQSTGAKVYYFNE